MRRKEKMSCRERKREGGRRLVEETEEEETDDRNVYDGYNHVAYYRKLSFYEIADSGAPTAACALLRSLLLWPQTVKLHPPTMANNIQTVRAHTKAEDVQQHRPSAI